jgi:hypothetical protein
MKHVFRRRWLTDHLTKETFHLQKNLKAKDYDLNIDTATAQEPQHATAR